MAAIDERRIRGRRRGEPLQAKYGTTVDRESAHERITARLAAARAAAAEAATRAGLDPTTAGGLNTMTPAQQQREIARQANAIEAAEERARREAERQRVGLEQGGRRTRARQRTIDTAIRTGGRVVTSADGAGHHPGRLRHPVRGRQGPLTR